jgi:hypothetical protein
LFRLGRFNGFDAKIEETFDKGYRADVLWRRRSESEQRERPKLCLEVDLTPTGSVEQGLRFELRKKQGWYPVALMDRTKPNRAHVDLPRLLVRKLKETARESARGEKPEYGVERLFVANVSMLECAEWVRRPSVRLEHILMWIAQGSFDYIEVKPGRKLGLKGKWAWVHVDDLDDLQIIKKLDEDEQLARERQQEEHQKVAREAEQRKGQQGLELDQQQLVHEFEHDAEKLAVLDALKIESEDTSESEDTWAEFLKRTFENPSWVSETETQLVEAVEQLYAWRRSVDQRERLEDRARILRTDAIVDVRERLEDHRTRREKLGAAQLKQSNGVIKTERGQSVGLR